MYGKCTHTADSSSCKRLGFLQKNNSLEERSRIVSSLKERTAKNLLSCDNIGGDARFRRTEVDFSNLFARGRLGKTVEVDELCLFFEMKHDALNIEYATWRNPTLCGHFNVKSSMQVMPGKEKSE